MSESLTTSDISDSPFKVGDKVTVLSNSMSASAIIGEMAEVTGVHKNDVVYVRQGQSVWALCSRDVRHADPEAKYEPVVGDVVEFDNFFGLENAKAIIYNSGYNRNKPVLAIEVENGQWCELYKRLDEEWSSDMTGLKLICHTDIVKDGYMTHQEAKEIAKAYFSEKE